MRLYDGNEEGLLFVGECAVDEGDIALKGGWPRPFVANNRMFEEDAGVRTRPAGAAPKGAAIHAGWSTGGPALAEPFQSFTGKDTWSQ